MAQLKRPWLWREETGELVQSGTAVHGQAAQSKKAVASVPPSLQDKSQPDRKVTLEDVKVVGINLVSERSLLSTHKRVALLFDQCYRTNQMNYLLWSSLAYFDAYQHYTKTSRNAASGARVAGMKHQQALKEAQEKLGQCQANLGKSYSLFILGLEHWKSHHSLGGRSRVSKTQTDQMFFEILYEFVLLCIWICFGYENWEDIRKEMGRVFRTSAFNRDYLGSRDQSVAIDGLGPVARNSDEYIAYRVHYERPPVGSLKCLRSPALENILPSRSKMTQSSRSGDSWQCWSKDTQEDTEHLGVIGHPLSLYDPHSLKPLAKNLLEDESESESDVGESDVDGSELEEDHDLLSLHS